MAVPIQKLSVFFVFESLSLQRSAATLSKHALSLFELKFAICVYLSELKTMP
jgi:hypothetical protein